MAVTYTTASQRDARRAASGAWNFGSIDLRLVAVSVAALLAITLTGCGRVKSFAYLAGPNAPPVHNLNTIPDAAPLEQVLTRVFENPADRKLAARELFGRAVSADGGRRLLPNVGDLARARVPAEVIDKTDRLTVYRERLRVARENRPDSPPTSVAALSSSELASIKPQLVVRTASEYRQSLMFWALIYIASFHAVVFFWRWRGIPGDHLLLTVLHGLTAIGLIAMAARPDPLRDTLLFERYATLTTAGVLIFGAVTALGSRVNALQGFKYLALAAALLLSIVLILFGSGPGTSDARVNLGPAQPIEVIRLLLGIFVAGYFARRWELLPRLTYVIPVLAGVAAALVLFFFQKDLGPALVLALVFLSLYVIARGSYVLAAAGIALLVAGFYAGYQLNISTTVVDRIYMWQSPWDNLARRGDQVAQAAWSLAAGGFFGTGMGYGDTRYLPAGETDLILTSIGEELGFFGVLLVCGLYALLVWRSITIARRANGDFPFFLAVALTLLTAIPMLLMIAGTLGAIPLTGVVTPFLSYGGSAMIANCAALGLIAAVGVSSGTVPDLAMFDRRLQVVTIALAVVGAGLLAAMFRVQVWNADEILVRPQLGVQADGSRRYQYNPRILDVAAAIPRGSILDRRGVPLATADRSILTKSAPEYQKLGITLDAACPPAQERCYPLAGRAFHLVGDSSTRTNWSASNSSYLERDAEAGLRGFDDHQTTVRTSSPDGSPATALRRDYRELVPLFRNRYDRDHPAMKAVFDRPRDLKTTIDARLQHQAAGILADHAVRAKAAHGAAVVIDVATGELLASASYPWPEPEAPAEKLNERLLDRARYGLYPPGSTFKLVTAASALRRDPQLANATFACTRLPDGRVGAQISGWSRPIRDDILDREPHGTVSLHEGLVVSCNAYFANLAVRIGANALVETAERAEIAVARGNAAARVRDLLPQTGYGQGDVLASPLRMARIAAAIGGDGALRDVRLQQDAAAAPPRQFLNGSAAAMLARYMRDAVLDGTGRALRAHPARVAGKTGTAEVTGAPSHSWFIGFAPYGQAQRRVAVAVIIENAGYGASAAVPAAGDILTAAAALGYAK